MLGSLTRDQRGKVTCHDDVSGDVFKSELVLAARDLEVDHLKRMKVYVVGPRADARKSGKGKLTKGHWLFLTRVAPRTPMLEPDTWAGGSPPEST